MADKIYCGNAKIVKAQYGDLLKGSMHKDDINKAVAWMRANNSDWFNFSIKEKQNKVKGKPTHYLELDEWKPNDNKPVDNNPLPTEPTPPSDDLPF